MKSALRCAVGIDLGGSSIKAVAIAGGGEFRRRKPLLRRMIAFEESRPMQWAEKIARLVDEIQKELPTPAFELGLSAPGLATRDGRAIAHMPGRLQGLQGLDWTTFLGRERPVIVLNDAQAALLGEARAGAACGCDNVIMLTLGTGVGGAAIVDGKLLHGAIGRAGHLGHICLDPEGQPDVCGVPGSLELAIGNCSVRERSGGRFRSTRQLLSAARRGDAEAKRIWIESIKRLACALTSFINILDPALIVMGGGIATAGPALFRPLRKFLRPIEWQPGGRQVRITAAELGEFAGAYGAAWNSLAAPLHSSERQWRRDRD